MRASDPQLSVITLESGWYVQCQPEITYDWTAESTDAWTIPMGADIGKAFKMGSQDLSLQVGAYDLLTDIVLMDARRCHSLGERCRQAVASAMCAHR
jgi:hypothetical protein